MASFDPPLESSRENSSGLSDEIPEKSRDVFKNAEIVFEKEVSVTTVK